MDTSPYGTCERWLPEIYPMRELAKCQANITRQFLVGKKLGFLLGVKSFFFTLSWLKPLVFEVLCKFNRIQLQLAATRENCEVKERSRSNAI